MANQAPTPTFDLDMPPLQPRTRAALLWAALHAVGVPGRARLSILADGGAEAVLDRGTLVVHNERGGSRPLTFARAEAVALAAPVEHFLAAGGRILGGDDAVTLGIAGRRPRAPLCVYARGGLDPCAARPAVAIVGSREATALGLGRARALAHALAAHGVTVVSGGARGVDSAAHEGALTAGGTTVAVLGEPLRASGEDERPRWLRAAFDAGHARAVSLTPYGPWVTVNRALFAARNALIAAYADAVVVIEGRAGSGTFHTAEAARRLGVPVFAVPGDPDQPTALAPNQLLVQEVARAVLPGPEAVGRVTGLGAALESPRTQGAALRPPRAEPAASAGAALAAPSPPPVIAALAALGGRALPDAIAGALGRPLSGVLTELALLELEGGIQRDGPYITAPGTRDG